MAPLPPPPIPVPLTVYSSVCRAQAAHENGWEAFAIFSVAILAAVVTGVDKEWAGVVALIHVLARLGFNIVYLYAVGPAPCPRTLNLRALFVLDSKLSQFGDCAWCVLCCSPQWARAACAVSCTALVQSHPSRSSSRRPGSRPPLPLCHCKKSAN